jgi:hypothetical protein
VIVRTALLVLVFNLVIFSVIVQHRQQQLKTRVLAAQVNRQEEMQRLNQLESYWEKVVTDSPTYRDGFVQLAVIDYRQGDLESSKKWLTKVYTIDPNYELPVTLAFLQPLVPEL